VGAVTGAAVIDVFLLRCDRPGSVPAVDHTVAAPLLCGQIGRSNVFVIMLILAGMLLGLSCAYAALVAYWRHAETPGLHRP
jgi:hypothetical protein